MSDKSMNESYQNDEAIAKARMLRVSPQKLNLVSRLIRNKPVNEALAQLRFSRKRIAIDVMKCLESAIANADLKNPGAEVDKYMITKAYVNEARTLKRFRPRAMGRASGIKSAPATSH